MAGIESVTMAVTAASATAAATSFDFEYLRMFASGVRDLIISTVQDIAHIISAIGEVQQTRDEVLDSGTKVELEQLRHALTELVNICKQFVDAAKHMAQYAMNENLHSKIEQELDANPPVIKTLSVLLNGIKSKFSRCTQNANTFMVEYDKLLKRIMEKTTAKNTEEAAQEEEVKKYTKQAQDAQNASIGIGIGGTMVSGLAAVGGAATLTVATGGLAILPGLALFVFSSATAAATVAGTAIKAVESANC